MNKMLIAISTALTISFVTWQAFAQVNQAGSVYCQINPMVVGCGPISSGSGGAPSSKPEIIHVYLKNRYGAYANNSKTGAIGFVNDYKCRESAEKAAIEQCGDASCKAVFFKNTCTAVVYGLAPNGEYMTFTNSDKDLPKAVTTTLNDCQAKGATQCKVLARGCSLPVQK